MDFRRTVLMATFGMSLFFLFDAYQKSVGQPGLFPAAKPAVSKSAAPVASNAPVDKNGVPTANAAASGAASAGVPNAAAGNATAGGEKITLANNVLKLTLDTAGGNVIGAELLKHLDSQDKKKNVVLLNSSSKTAYFAQSGLAAANGQPVPNHTAKTVYSVVENSPAKLVLSATTGDVSLTKTFELAANSYAVKVTHTVKNATAAALNPVLYTQLARTSAKPAGESQFYATFTGPAVYSDEKKFEKLEFSDIEKGKSKFNKAIKANEPSWVAMIEHYFVSSWIPANKGAKDHYTDTIPNGSDKDATLYTVGSKYSLGEIAAGASAEQSHTLYVGPQDQDALEKLAPGLELVVDYGMFTIFAKPMFALLKFFYNLIGNWGWAIVLLTCTIKALLYFPMAMSYRSMAKMKNVAPKLKTIQERYGNDKVKLNQEMMQLYRTEKINPLGGCLPILLTIPIFIALYWVLLASVEIRNAPWIGWITDLSAPDHWYVLPVLLAATMWAQFKLSPTPPDPMQAKVMMVMQAVFAVMFVFFPSGLNLYYLVNNVLSIAQQWFITRQIAKEEAAAKVKRN